MTHTDPREKQRNSRAGATAADDGDTKLAQIFRVRPAESTDLPVEFLARHTAASAWIAKRPSFAEDTQHRCFVHGIRSRASLFCRTVGPCNDPASVVHDHRDEPILAVEPVLRDLNKFLVGDIILRREG